MAVTSTICVLKSTPTHPPCGPYQVAALRRVLEADEDLMAAAVTGTGAAELAAGGGGEVLRGLQQHLGGGMGDKGGGMENSARRGKKAKKKARQR